MHRLAILAASAFACGTGALLAAAPARAIDSVSGVYEGKVRCNEISGGVASKLKEEVTVNVLEGAEQSFTMDIVGATPVLSGIGGLIAEDAAKSDRAKLTGASCFLTHANTTGGAVHIDVVIKPGSEKGTLKGTILGMTAASARASFCTLDAKRTSTAPPETQLCK